MSALQTQVLAANAAYVASFGEKGALALPPARSAAFVVCMDARIDPCAAFGIKEGDAHVIRNAGGRVTDDALRSLVISHKLLGTKEWFVVHHSDCGMEYFNGALMGTLLEGSLATASIVPDAAAPKGVTFANASAEGGSKLGHSVHWHTIEDQEASVKEDVQRICSYELVAPGIPVSGWVYDVKTGKLNHVVSAVTKA